jgi:hypothetical protein
VGDLKRDGLTGGRHNDIPLIFLLSDYNDNKNVTAVKLVDNPKFK